MIYDNSLGPREKERRVGASPGTARHRQLPRSPLHKTENESRLDDIAGNRRDAGEPARQCCRRIVGRYALGFEHGFRQGRVDALRVAMRKIDDLDALATLTRLADEYAAGDR
jgi:hypothetical protein